MRAKPYSLSMKVAIRDEHGRVLILKRSMSSKNNGGKWEFPGGKVDAGEDIDEALLREVREETGLSISLEKVLGSAESETPMKKVAYLILDAQVLSGSVRLSNEHTDYAWVEPSAMAEADLCPQFQTFAAYYAEKKQV